MNTILITLFILVLAAALFVFSRKSRGGSGGDRSDAVERPELTGTEQYKRRAPP